MDGFNYEIFKYIVLVRVKEMDISIFQLHSVLFFSNFGVGLQASCAFLVFYWNLFFRISATRLSLLIVIISNLQSCTDSLRIQFN